MGSYAQKSVIKFNPVSLIFGVGKVTYENVLDEGSSLELSLTYSSLDLGELFGKSTGLGGQGKYKIYFANGGDRTEENVPELDVCRRLDVVMLWGVGGGKIQSSSWLINGGKDE